MPALPCAPLPWTLDVTPAGDLVVRDATGRPVYAGHDHEAIVERIGDLIARTPTDYRTAALTG